MQKSHKIASALYLVTSFFNDQEPLKWKLRSLSANLVSEEIKDKSSITKEILSLFSLARTVGIVSETNHEILASELSKLEREAEKPLDALFFHDIIAEKKSLPQPRETEPVKDKTFERVLETPSLKEFGAVSVKKNSRQSIIIGLLKRKKEIMIKDVSPLIGGCSEKTVQRELLAMVQAGILRKTGEKRWSRYSLA